MHSWLKRRPSPIVNSAALILISGSAVVTAALAPALLWAPLLLSLLWGAYASFHLWQQDKAVEATTAARYASDQRNLLFAAAIESSPASVVIADATRPGNPIIFVNQAFTTITGYSREEALERSCSFLQGIHTDKDSIATISAGLRARKPVEVTLLNYRKDQTPFWNDLRISPLFNAAGDLTHYIALQADVTAMHTTQQALTIAKEQAERANTVKSNFMAMMSHEIRTPISGVLGTLALLNEMPLAAEAKQLAVTAHESADALLTIVNDMLDFSKIEAGKLTLEYTQFSLRDLVNGCLSILQPSADAKKIELRLDFDTTLPPIVVSDPTRIKQVLLNLLSNAVKFTAVGHVTLKISNLLASTAGADTIVRFEVSDTGIGMSQDGMTRIFTEFNQLDPTIARRYGGTGLGLAICKRLIAMMHGEIEVESRLGVGSKFWFVLPLQHAVAESLPVAAAHRTAGRSKHGSILVAEDNATNQLVITKMLERLGLRCTIAENGALALRMVQEADYDLIFMDVSMPVMDGLSATRAIRELGGKYAVLPIVAMTAQSMPGDRERCLNAGMNDYLSKPINRDALHATLDHYIKPDTAANNSSATVIALPLDVLPYPEESSTLDWQVLAQMAQDVGFNTVNRLLDIFANDLQERIRTFHAALASEDWATMRHEAHSLKSSSASCGLTALAAKMQDIENALSSDNTAQALDHARMVDPLATAAHTALQQAHAYYQAAAQHG